MTQITLVLLNKYFGPLLNNAPDLMPVVCQIRLHGDASSGERSRHVNMLKLAACYVQNRLGCSCDPRTCDTDTKYKENLKAVSDRPDQVSSGLIEFQGL